MFQLLNIQALLARDYQIGEPGGPWRIARLDMIGGREGDSSAWSIQLARGQHRRLLGWSDFLQRAHFAGATSPAVGPTLDQALQQVQQRLSERTRRRDLLRALRGGTPAAGLLDLLTRGAPELAGWLHSSRALDPASSGGPTELLDAWAADAAADRQLLRTALQTAAPTPPIRLNPGAGSVPATGTRNLLGERIDQSCAACRDLLTLSGSRPSPDRAQSVARAVLAGSVEAWLDDRLRFVLVDQGFSVQVRSDTTPTDRATTSGLATFAAELKVPVPLWTLQPRTDFTLAVTVAIAGPARAAARPVESLLQDTAGWLHAWADGRATPLVSGGDGWLGLLDHMPWDQDRFSRWLAAAPLHERVGRLVALGRPPEGRERQNGWQALLDSIAADAAHLRALDWRALAPILSSWAAPAREELIAALRRAMVARIGAKDAPLAEIAVWLAAWRDAGSPGDPFNLLAGLCARAARQPADEEIQATHAFWREVGRPADTIAPLAALWKERTPTDEVVRELAEALPATDARRRAALALLACLATVDPAHLRNALPPLAQRDADPARWSLETDWRGQVPTWFAEWTRRLDGRQQHAAWPVLLEQRRQLIDCGLLPS